MEELFIQPRRKLARLLNIPPSTLYYRIQKLRKRKEIIGYYSAGRAMLYKRIN